MREPQRVQMTTSGEPGAASRLPQGATIHRGETRLIVPSPEFPDPSSADPEALLRHHLTSRFGVSVSHHRRIWGVGPDNQDHSVGVHWTPREQVIAHRFTEGNGRREQSGRPMQDWESRGIREFDLDEMVMRRRSPVARSAHRSLRDAYDARSRDRSHTWRDLSGASQHFGDNPRSNAAVPYSMGVIWHGELDHSAVDLDERVTGFESEIDLTPGAQVKIHGATLDLPSPGRTHSFAQGGGWQKVQFKEPVVARIGSRPRRWA